jgi:hypothetical protein
MGGGEASRAYTGRKGVRPVIQICSGSSSTSVPGELGDRLLCVERGKLRKTSFDSVPLARGWCFLVSDALLPPLTDSNRTHSRAWAIRWIAGMSAPRISLCGDTHFFTRIFCTGCHDYTPLVSDLMRSRFQWPMIELRVVPIADAI